MISEKKSVVFLELQGMGLSTSWQGNALAVANPKNMSRFWQSYPSAPLSAYNSQHSKIGFLSNPLVNYASTSCGRDFIPDFDFINEHLESGLFSHNKVFSEAIELAEKQFATLHLIGAISGDGFYGEIRHLFALLDAAKDKGCRRIYLHLLFDTETLGPDKVAEIVTSVQTYLGELEVGQIASIIKQESLHDSNYHSRGYAESFRAIVRGKGRSALSPEQAVTLGFGGGRAQKSINAFSIIEGGSPIGVIKDFDSVLFFNHNLEGTRSLVGSFIDSSLASVPRGLKICTMTNPFHVRHEKINILFERKYDGTIFEKLDKAGLRSAAVVESGAYSALDFFKGCKAEPNLSEDIITTLNSPSGYIKNYQKYTKNILSSIGLKVQAGFDFIYANISCVDQVANFGKFSHVVESIIFLDGLLPLLEKFALESNVTLLVSSPYGKVETILSSNQLTDWTAPSLNAVPLIVVSKDKKIIPRVVLPLKDQLMHELVRLRYSITDIAPIIEKILLGESPEVAESTKKLLDHVGAID